VSPSLCCRLTALASAALVSLAWSAPARADPCEGALPGTGVRFAGVVRYVGDGDSLCIGPASRPEQWIEVRLGDFYAPELRASGGASARERLRRLALGKPLVCRAGKRSYDRVVGYCTLGGRALGRLLREAGGTQGGRGWP
jgi:endonuclease YncB( thermonuclease family)